MSLCNVRKERQVLKMKVELKITIIREVSRRNVYLIDTKNIVDTCLGMKELHLNRQGASYIAKYLLIYDSITLMLDLLREHMSI